MIASMRRSLCTAVNAQLCSARQSAKYKDIGTFVDKKINLLLSKSEKPTANEKVVFYDRGTFELREYVYFGKNPVSFLFLKDRHTGKKLDLLQLLTDEAHFVPKVLQDAHLKQALTEEQKAELIMKYQQEEQKDYQSWNHLSMEYNVGKKNGYIIYEDLTRPCSMLIMLHEIAHLWQQAWWPVESQCFSFIKTAMKDASFDDVKKFNDILSKSSIEISLNHIETRDSRYNIESQKLFLMPSDSRSTFIFDDKSVIGQEILQGFLWKERHAWLVAMHLYKKLKREFINVEPELEEHDLIRFVNQSYQSHVDSLNRMLRYDWRNV